ncbi:MAG: efflux RND transporter periplasmic adaptor subunit [Muribaculaceae bacterium]|nr:efflux RND transporter periplasmic adaptor subunit [Muribaculaceae bacterium]
MKPLKFLAILSLLLAAGASSCGSKPADDADKESVTADAPDLVTEVDTLHLVPGMFAANIISNGHVKAAQWADIYFRNAEIISDVMVRNGQRVRKGQPLARLDLFKLNSEKEKNAAALEQARLELQDVLIGQGYDPSNTSAVPEDVMRLARVRSGLLQAEATYNATIKDIEQSTLTSPYDGVVANVKATPHSMASMSEPFCRVIDTNSMEVEFSVLESEGTTLSNGEQVTVTPFTQGASHTGRITEINPLIDENGHIQVKARLADGKGLIDGMNVRVNINRPVGERLMVPKSAVVLRSGRPVVFTLDGKKAIWNYVTTGMENLDSYEITDGLSGGETVIVSGCENLAHEAPVNVKSK